MQRASSRGRVVLRRESLLGRGCRVAMDDVDGGGDGDGRRRGGVNGLEEGYVRIRGRGDSEGGGWVVGLGEGKE